MNEYPVPLDIAYIINPHSPGITFQFTITHYWNGTSHLVFPDMSINPQSQIWLGNLFSNIGKQLLQNQ